MQKAVIITSIFEPTKAVKEFALKSDYTTIVVGDVKSPAGWKCDNTEYLSIEQQQQLNYAIIKLLPYNHYCRKMIGYLKCIKEDYDVIIDTDDDNLPYKDWSFPQFEDQFLQSPPDLGFINIYKSFTDKKIWPRGLPLDKLTNENVNLPLHERSQRAACHVGIWQGLADGDPDVDAIYRLTSNEEMRI